MDEKTREILQRVHAALLDAAGGVPAEFWDKGGTGHDVANDLMEVIAASKPRRLPGGGSTNNVDAYTTAWQEFVESITSVLGWRLASYDPGFAFETPSGERVYLNEESAGQLAKALDRVPVEQAKVEKERRRWAVNFDIRVPILVEIIAKDEDTAVELVMDREPEEWLEDARIEDAEILPECITVTPGE
jgi:hypothetical protein